MNYYLMLMVISILIIIICISIFFLYEYVEYSVDKNYRNLPNTIINNNTNNNCPSGCSKGTCNSETNCRNEECCSFDFQCQYCKDNSNEYYMKPNYNPYAEISINESQESNELSQLEKINQAIAKQNEYIYKLNQDINNS